MNTAVTASSPDPQRIERLEEREEERRLSRRFRRQAEAPPEGWNPEDRADFFEQLRQAVRLGQSKVRPPRRRLPLPAVSVTPFGAVAASMPNHDNPFLDKLGRPFPSQKMSSHLTQADLSRCYELMLRGNAMGLVFSTHVTIVWKTVGVLSDGQVAQAQQHLFSTLRAFEKRRRRTVDDRGFMPILAWVWMLERGDVNGLHTHIVLACPQAERTRLLRAIHRSVESFSGKVPVPRDEGENPKPATIVMTHAFRKKGGLCSHKTELRQQWVYFRYVFKGLETRASRWGGLVWGERFVPIIKRAEQGLIQGQRWGYSAGVLGPKAWPRYAAMARAQVSGPRDEIVLNGMRFPT